MIVYCDYPPCHKEINRRPFMIKRSKRHYCNIICQNKNDKLRGIDKTIKAHQIIREKGHYKRDNSYLIGKNNKEWRGNKVGYRGLHAWVRRHLGKPLYCSKDLSHKDTSFMWCNISGEYKREASDWRQLCNSCNQTDHIPVHPRFK